MQRELGTTLELHRARRTRASIACVLLSALSFSACALERTESAEAPLRTRTGGASAFTARSRTGVAVLPPGPGQFEWEPPAGGGGEGKPPALKILETDVAHLGGTFSPVPPLVVAAAGSGVEVELSSWAPSNSPGAPPTQLGSSLSFGGHDVKLHVLTPDVAPKLQHEMLVSAVIEKHVLWLTSWRVEASGEFTELDTRGYGTYVRAYDIAHRVTLRDGELHRFQVVTPVATAYNQIRLVTWSVHPETGAIVGKSESPPWDTVAHPVTQLSATRIEGDGMLGPYFAVSFRNASGNLATHFWRTNNGGLIESRGSGESGLSIGGDSQYVEPARHVDTIGLTHTGMLTALEQTSGRLKLVAWDNRLDCLGDVGCFVRPHHISDDTFDPTPNSVGVPLTQPLLLSQGAVVLDAKHDQALLRSCSDIQQGIASVTKVMTLIEALEAVEAGSIKLDDPVIEISQAAADVAGSATGFEQGEVHSLRTLLWSLMVDSGNDAAIAIAEHLGGSVDGFVAMMGAEAAERGLADSIYCQPAGGCFSTAMDQAQLWASVYDHPEFLTFSGSANEAPCGDDGSGGEACYFFDKDAAFHPGVTSWKGGSKGFFCSGIPETKGLPLCASGGCLSAQAERLERPLVVSVLQPQPKTGGPFTDAERMWDFGYRKLYTPDYLGNSSQSTLSAIDFGLDYITDAQAVTAHVNIDRALEVCSWTMNIALGQVEASACVKAAVGPLSPGTVAPPRQEVEIVRPSTLEADGDYLLGQLDQNDFVLSLWRLGPHEVAVEEEGACCGDGVKNGKEECDGTDFGGASCSDLGHPMGSLSCSDACRIDGNSCDGGTSTEPPGSYAACHYNGEACNHDPSQCNADGSCLGGPCQRTNPNANPLDPLSAYHPDGNFKDQHGNLYYCPDSSENGEMVCIDEDGWGVCRRCADGGELSTRLGCSCQENAQCDNNEPGLTCYGAESGGGPGFCWSGSEGPPFWQCAEARCGMAPWYKDDTMYCHHYWGTVASNAGCQTYYTCDGPKADSCTLSGKICTPGDPDAAGCDNGICCGDTCSLDSDCAASLSWPAGYVCGNGDCVPGS